MTQSFVLFVDDSRLCSLVTSEILRDHGFDVMEVYSADGAYRLLDQPTAPLALVTDIDLGGGPDGFDIARRARAAYPHIPVVYVSGSSAARHLAEGVEGSEFIAKPFRRQRIVEALNRVIALEACRLVATPRAVVGGWSAAQEVEEDRSAVAQFLGLVAGGDVVDRGSAPIVGGLDGPVEEAASNHPL